MPRNTAFIPAAMFDNLVNGIAADMAKLQPDIVTGQIAPHQIAELLAGYGIAPDDMAKQIIDDANADAARQAESMVPAMARPAA